MHRFLLPPENCQGEFVTLSGADAHHAAVVLRLHPGERVGILDGAGTELRGQVEAVTKSAVSVRVGERIRHPNRPFELHLAQALLKGRAWDSVLEKATELGVASLQPLTTERCVVRLSAADSTGKLAGWRATTIAAAKQCGTPWLPALEPPATPGAWLKKNRPSAAELRLIASLEPGARTIRAAVQEFHQHHGSRPTRVTMIIGPEGDFTPAEYEEFRAAGAVPISLGPLVLRADTAAIATLAIAGAELREG